MRENIVLKVSVSGKYVAWYRFGAVNRQMNANLARQLIRRDRRIQAIRAYDRVGG